MTLYIELGLQTRYCEVNVHTIVWKIKSFIYKVPLLSGTTSAVNALQTSAHLHPTSYTRPP
jgi:hypothetical protein